MKSNDWDKLMDAALIRGARTAKRYASTVCVRCGREIHEGAYSGRAGNFKRHAAACDRKAREAVPRPAS